MVQEMGPRLTSPKHSIADEFGIPDVLGPNNDTSAYLLANWWYFHSGKQQLDALLLCLADPVL